MKKYLIALLFCFLPAFAQAQTTTIAAIVNNDIITNNDVLGRINLATNGLSIKPDAETMAQIKKQALDALIDEEIRLQEAKRLGVTPAQKEVDDAFSNLAKQNGATAKQFKLALEKHAGAYSSLKRQLKTQIAWGNVVRSKVRPQISVSEDDITAYLADKQKNPAKVSYEVAEIFLRNTDANIALAKQLHDELITGKKRFSVVARQFSQGLEASKGGLLGWIDEGKLEPVLDEAIKKTPPGQISAPVLSPRGIHIFLIRNRKDILPMQQESQRIDVRQIAVPLPPKMTAEIRAQAMAFTEELRARAKDCAAMDALIKEINKPSARNLGTVRLGDLPPMIMNAVKDQPENKATAPLVANEGIAFFMVCKRENNTAQLVRDDAANMIGTDRLNRLQGRYFRDLRAAAYVDIHNDK